jgi:hypothetical protein
LQQQQLQQQPDATTHKYNMFCSGEITNRDARTWRATRSFSVRSSVSLRSAASWSSISFLSSLSAARNASNKNGQEYLINAATSHIACSAGVLNELLEIAVCSTTVDDRCAKQP